MSLLDHKFGQGGIVVSQLEDVLNSHEFWFGVLCH
jgi:hypothetical protein